MFIVRYDRIFTQGTAGLIATQYEARLTNTHTHTHILTLLTYKNYTKMHGQKNVKTNDPIFSAMFQIRIQVFFDYLYVISTKEGSPETPCITQVENFLYDNNPPEIQRIE